MSRLLRFLGLVLVLTLSMVGVWYLSARLLPEELLRPFFAARFSNVVGEFTFWKVFHDKQITFAELVAGLTRDNPSASSGQVLVGLTDEMIDTTLALIAGCADADVTFEPVDPQAYDPYAATPEEVHMAWTLGHVIVHNTASSEESAAVAAELARGVAYHGRSRYETPWTELRTIAGCRQRLEESRRMRLASLGMWPDAAHLEKEYQAWTDGPMVNAIGRFVLGLMHEASHLEQIREIVRQAQAARGG